LAWKGREFAPNADGKPCCGNGAKHAEVCSVGPVELTATTVLAPSVTKVEGWTFFEFQVRPPKLQGVANTALRMVNSVSKST
jgi:hypothetical protein